jgi:GWxTD domain-containing protein
MNLFKVKMVCHGRQRFNLLLILMVLSLNAFGRISASVDYLIFPGESGNGRLVLLFGIDGASLFWKKNAAGKFSARSSFAVSVNDSVRNYFAERLDFNTPEVSDSSGFRQSFSAWKTIILPAGKFKVEMLVFDAFSADTSREQLVFSVNIADARQAPVLSDMLFLEPSAFRKGIPVFEQNASAIRNSDFFTKNDSLISIYAEAHGFLNRFSPAATLVSRLRILRRGSRESLDEFGKISRIKTSASMAWITELSIRNLSSGNYILNWDILDSTGKIVAVINRNFQRSNPGMDEQSASRETAGLPPDLLSELKGIPTETCRHLVASLYPISRSSDQPTIDYLRKSGTEQELRNFMASFWSKKAPSEALNSFRRFRNLVAEADHKYSTQTMKGYQTERGRVYIQYGKPDLLENEQSDRFRKAMTNLNTIPYEVWYYYTLDEPVKQTDVMFVFVQQNRGNYNYRLLHSSAIGEVRNTEWRKVVENNATYNFDRMNPDDSGEIGNPRQAR